MSKELVYNIGNIFNAKNHEGALYQYEAKKYFIAPYQRGYKWASKSPNDAVCLLMKDLFDASESGAGEYYLQFITTKESIVEDIRVMEVIDGQQRLTTLTILLTVLAHILQTGDAQSNNLLSYEVRPKVSEFFQAYIYGDITLVLSHSWEEFIKLRPDMNEQDIYYLFAAIKKVREMLADTYRDNQNGLAHFQNYVLENVKIILNNIERDISCEELFGNLNDNKVELSSAELIKGLLLTNAPREKTDKEQTRVNYKELLEIRAVMGRQWDEISTWVNRKGIRTYFFGNANNKLDELLLLLVLNDGYKENTSTANQTDIFNHIQSNLRKGKKTTGQYFEDLKNLRYILNEWFLDDEIYNGLGYLLFSKGSRKTIKDFLPMLEYCKTDIKAELKKQIASMLPDNINELEYGQDNNEIHNLLLALSVFTDNSRFNFTAYSSQSGWSLEHIFPQNAAALPDILGEKDLDLVKALATDKLEDYNLVKDKLSVLHDAMDVESVFTSLQSKLNEKNGNLTGDEKIILYRILKSGKLNSIGNMALLKGSDNSSNGNNMFDRKRHNIVRRVSNGSFVPKHTYDVFSKLISQQMTSDLKVWTENDIDRHTEWIKVKIASLKN